LFSLLIYCAGASRRGRPTERLGARHVLPQRETSHIPRGDRQRCGLMHHYSSRKKRATFHEVTVSDSASRYHYCSHEKTSHLPRGDRQRCGLIHHYCSHEKRATFHEVTVSDADLCYHYCSQEKRATFHEVTVSIVSAPMRPGAPISVATCHEVTVSNQLMRLNATGHVWYVVK